MDSHTGLQLGVKPSFARMDSHQDGLTYVNFDYAPVVAPTTATVAYSHATTSGTHLLALPREIRNQIYTYLHQPLQFRWEINKHDVHCAAISVSQAPIPSVLQTCTRLRDEYQESPIFRNLSATLSTTRATNHETAALTDMQCHAVCDSVILHTTPTPLEHIATLFSSLRTLTILTSNKRSMPSDPSIWSALSTLENLLSPFLDTLHTIRIGIQQCQDPAPLQMGSRREKKTYSDPSLSTKTFLPSPMASFMGKQLRQQAAGYRLQLVLLQLHPSDEKDLLERFHRHKTGVYVYSSLPLSPGSSFSREREMYWDEDEVIQSFPMRASWFNMQRSMNLNLRDRFDKFGVTDKWIESEYRGLAQKMMEWRDLRGEGAGEWEG